MRQKEQSLSRLIRVARGEQPADLVLKNASVVNVLSGEIHRTDVAIFQGRIAGLGSYCGISESDLQGRYLAPGFIDGHVHLESSKLLPSEYAETVVPKGTTAIVMDPHEIANVLGLEGIEWILAATASGPLCVYCMLPSCVPATDLETSGSRLSARDLAPLVKNARVLGIAELMNFPGVLAGESEVLRKLLLGRRKIIDGHAPGITGKDLCAYIAAGMRSDHECTSAEEALEKARLGMYVMIREGSAARNLEALVPAVTSKNSARFLFATDDRSPEDLMDEGHLDHLLRKAIGLGLDPITAIQMATINAATYFGLRSLGAVTPGYRADLAVIEDLETMRVLTVFKKGKLVAQEGRTVRGERIEPPQSIWPPSHMNVDGSAMSRLGVLAEGEHIKVAELIPGQIRTRLIVEKAMVRGRQVTSDAGRDILKVAVIERHQATGRVGVGFVRGFGMKAGALGSSVAHDSHNVIVAGVADEDIRAAAEEVIKMEGGQVVVENGQVLAALPLPLAGLMSDRPIEAVVAATRAMKRAARALGCMLDDPFMALSFLALPVIPEIRITDRGLVDVEQFRLTGLFAGA